MKNFIGSAKKFENFFLIAGMSACEKKNNNNEINLSVSVCSFRQIILKRKNYHQMFYCLSIVTK